MSYGDYIRERIAHTQKLNFTEGNPLYFTKCKEKPFKAFTLYGNAEHVENPEIIVCGKNLLDVSADTRLTQQDDGSYLNNIQIGIRRIPLNLPYGTYTLHYWMKTTYSSNSRIALTVNNAVQETTKVIRTNEEGFAEYQITVTGEIVEWYINYGAQPLIETLSIKNVQLEIGNSATEYEPYKTPQKVAVPYTFAENDYLTLLNKKVKTFINGVQTDITDSEVGQAILNLECFEPTTTILCNSETQPNNMYIKYISK